MCSERDSSYRRVTAVLAVVALGVLAIGLASLIAYAADAAGRVEKAFAKHLVRLAWLALVMLAFDVVMLFWLSIRLIAARERPSIMRRRSPYVDAWAAAGQRFQLADEDQGDDGGDPPAEGGGSAS